MSTTPYLLRLAWRGAPVLALACLFALIDRGFVVPYALLMRAIFDTITGEAAAGLNVWTLIAILTAANWFSLVVVVPVGRVATQFLRGLLEGRVQRNLIETLLERRPTGTGVSAGDMLNRFRDDVEALTAPVLALPTIFGVAVSGAVSIYIMASIDPLITVVALLPGVLVFGFTKALGRRIDALRRRTRETTGQVSSSLGEFLGAVQAIQVANAEERAVDHFQALSAGRRRADLKEGILDGVLRSVNGSTVVVTTAILLALAAPLMRDGSFTVGDFALFVTMIGGNYMAFLMQDLGEFLAALRRSRVSLERLVDLVPESPPRTIVRGGSLHVRGPIPEEPYPVKTAEHRLESVELDGLTYRRPESGRGIEDVSLTVPRGSFVVVTGRIGSGKTTLLEALLGMLPPDSGEIRLNGRPVDNPWDVFAPPLCAYTPQAPWLFSDTLRANILMGLEASDAELAAAIRLGVMEEDVRLPGDRAGDGRRPARRPPLRRSGAANGRGEDVRPGPRAPGVRRPLQRPRRRDRAAALGPSVRAAGDDRARRVAPPRRIPPRRRDRRAEGWPRRRGRQAGRPAQGVRGDAQAVGGRRGGQGRKRRVIRGAVRVPFSRTLRPPGPPAAGRRPDRRPGAPPSRRRPRSRPGGRRSSRPGTCTRWSAARPAPG